MIFILRDLRDIAVSNHFYILKDRSHRLHRYFASLPNDAARLRASILGVPSEELGGARASLSIREHAEGYRGWLSEPNCHVVRFEDLIGASGGGSEERQLASLRGMFAYAGIAVDEAEARGIAAAAIGSKSRTFRKGQAGDWRNHVDGELAALVDEELGDLLEAFGYEVQEA